MDFTAFVLHELPPPPGRVLEVGCGTDGGVVPALLAAGYDALGVDPHAPEGPQYRQEDFRTVEGAFDAVVAGRVLHHVHPLDAALDRLAELAPLLVVDEFAWDLIDPAAQEWYEERRRRLAASGTEPRAPASLDEWRTRHPDLHPHGVLLDALRARYAQRTFERLPYFYRWLRDPELEPVEAELVREGGLPAIGWRWTGVRRASR